MIQWMTKDGHWVRIRDMETSHIENCIRMLEKKLENSLEDDTEGYSYDDIERDIRDFKLEILWRDRSSRVGSSGVTP